MYFAALLTAITALAIGASAQGTVVPPGCKVVRKSAGSGEYSTVQAAVNSLSTSSSGSQCIFIYQGTYNEQVYIAKRTAQLTIYGYTTDVMSYTSNTVTITQSRSQDNQANNDLTATLRAHNAGLKVYNVNLVNTRGKGSQALAVSAQADKQGYYACKFVGFQDTILANEGNQIYQRCYIDGATDFIFGQRARAWFGKCDIRVKANGYITANGRDSADNPSYYIISDSNVKAADGASVASGSVYLGRPWRSWSRVIFQNTNLSGVINGAGWVRWSSETANTQNVYYREFGNTGSGASGNRASFSGKLSAANPITLLLGNNYASWVDTKYL